MSLLTTDILEYHNLTVGPLEAGSSKLQLLFRLDQEGARLPHLRGPGPTLADISKETYDSGLSAETAAEITGTTLYAGVYFRHFGHFIAECIHRLYARLEDDRLSKAKVAFHASGVKRNRIEAWLFPILDICGVDKDEVIFIDRPCRFENLIVPPQARVLNGPTMKPGYAELFPRRVEAPEGAAGKSYYVSRAKHFYSGTYAGETLIENYLKGHGFDILYPEEVHLPDVVRMLSTASDIIFSEGSAIHNLELCGKTRARIMVIGRRSGTAMRFGHIAQEYGAASHIFDKAHVLGPMEWDNAHNRPNRPRSISVLDVRALILEISTFFDISTEIPTEEACQQAIFADLGRYLLDERTTRPGSTSFEQLGVLLSDMRVACGRYRDIFHSAEEIEISGEP